ncbi:MULTISPECIES: hypothetical protein [unclassified Yoonia]|uniref:hypothetical protein n=1 Tax=unclassified Yoonia TaxID=2629118 RepID=UPI002AFF2D45|nr:MULTISPECIES: hypothetical protein [unclassified Yoonia]
MRALAILIIVAVIGFFGYQSAVEGRGPNAAIGVLTGATAAAEQAAAEQAAAEQAAAEQAAAEEAAAAEAEAAAAAEAEARAAAEAEAQAAADAAAAEAEAAAAAVEEAIEDAATATEDAIENTSDALEDTGADVAASADELLTVDGFDANQVIALIQGSNLGEQEKTTLISAVTAAQNSPTLLQPVLERISQVLGQ